MGSGLGGWGRVVLGRVREGRRVWFGEGVRGRAGGVG